eukprot:CAMPEP_0114557390 /NCGR_PEP_ID=MMETSP0114-20121206/9806_1 /TAXON_ID=31324 /ORGANISM="Goniomonas sp, Strain m" /LENGTH=695 /DNA_ID=CAMNT_0001742677 /DNA_START=47 /DNA_END=2134 /DNA_ORIENTATION=-
MAILRIGNVGCKRSQHRDLRSAVRAGFAVAMIAVVVVGFAANGGAFSPVLSEHMYHDSGWHLQHTSTAHTGRHSHPLDVFRPSHQRALLCNVADGGSGGLYPPELFTEEEKMNGALLFYAMGVIYMFFALAIVCDEFFVPALEVIVEKFEISNDVAGATFMAAGGSAPELCTSFIGTFISQDSVGFGTIVGSATFNVLFVIAMCALFSKEILEVTWWPLSRDCLYYAMSLGILSIFFGVNSAEEVEIWESAILLGLYGGYVLLMKNNVKLRDSVYSLIGKKTNKISDVEMGETAGGEGSPEQLITEQHHVATFRSGFTSLLVNNKTMMETAAIHCVAAIQGDVRTTFSKVDKDDSGLIDMDELKTLLIEMGGHPSDEDVQRTMQSIDLDKDGQINFQEFSHWYAASEDRVKIELLQAFNKYDKDSSGFIDARELKALLEEMHGTVGDDLVSEVMTQLDKDGDGQLSRSEFEEWYCHTEFFFHRKQEVEDEAEEAEGLSLAWPTSPRARVMYLFLAPITFSLYYSLPNVRKPEWRNFYAWSFLGSIGWIGCYSYFMVWWAGVIGLSLNIPSAVMGLTVLAAGTSIPDLLTSVIVAKQGEGDMAVSSSIGSNIFDILIGLPLPWFFWSLAHNTDPIKVASGTLFLNVLILFGMLLAVIFIIWVCKWRLTKPLALSMVILYIMYIIQDLLHVYWDCIS